MNDYQTFETVRNILQTLCLYWYLQYPSAKSNFNDTSKSARIITLILTIAFLFYLRAFWSVRFLWGDIFFMIYTFIFDHWSSIEQRMERNFYHLDRYNQRHRYSIYEWMADAGNNDRLRERILKSKMKEPCMVKCDSPDHSDSEFHTHSLFNGMGPTSTGMGWVPVRSRWLCTSSVCRTPVAR